MPSLSGRLRDSSCPEARYLRRLAAHIPLSALDEQHRILDVGFGRPDLLALAARSTGAMACGVDINPIAIGRTPRSSEITLLLADGENLPFKDRSFDLVIEKDMLHHTKNRRRALDELVRVSKRFVVFMESNRMHPVMYVHLTLLGGHDHLKQREFYQMCQAVSSREFGWKFAQLETHSYPVSSNSLLRLLYFLEELVERMPFTKKLLAYNIALGTREEAEA